MHSYWEASIGHRLFLCAPLLLIFMSFATVAYGRASPMGSHAIYQLPLPAKGLNGCSRGRYRNTHTCRCRPGDFGN